jgi:hypothetical protein
MVTQGLATILWMRRLEMSKLDLLLIIWTNFGARPPSIIVSFRPALCTPLSHTSIATPETRRYRSCGSITLWYSSCFIPCFVFTLEKTIMRQLYSPTTITNYLLRKWMMIRWNCTLKLTMTIPISLGCGWVMEEKCDEKLLLGDVGKIWCKTCRLFKLVEFILSMSLKHMNS